MSEFKEKLTEAGMSESLATLLDERLSAQNAQPSCGDKPSVSGAISGACDAMGKFSGSPAVKRGFPVVAFAALAVVTLAALKYLMFD